MNPAGMACQQRNCAWRHKTHENSAPARIKGGQRGYVLVATIWILALVMIAATYFAARVERAVQIARYARESVAARLEMENTRADIMFRLGTQPIGLYGLGGVAETSVALDNRRYHGVGADFVQLQDERGLVNLNFVNAALLSGLLGTLEVPSSQWGGMLDTLDDYKDTDTFRHLNGAEATEYRAAGLPMPPNDWLLTPYQMRYVIGWREQPSLWENQRLIGLVSASRQLALNPNTAPLEVLASLPGSNMEIAQAMAARRRVTPFQSINDLASMLPNALQQEEFLLLYPGLSIRVTQSAPDLPLAEQYSLTLTPFDEGAPWRIDYYAATPVTLPPRNETDIPSLPQLSLSTGIAPAL